MTHPLQEDASHFEGRVFAFLPTEEVSGFPFVVNADFLLSASREKIKADLPWNRWLLDCIAPTVAEAVRAKKTLSSFRWVPLLPLAGQTDRFRSVLLLTLLALLLVLRLILILLMLTKLSPLLGTSNNEPDETSFFLPAI